MSAETDQRRDPALEREESGECLLEEPNFIGRMPSTGDTQLEVVASLKNQHHRRSAFYTGTVDVVTTSTRAAIVMVCHAVLSAVVVSSMWSIQKLIELYGNGKSMLVYNKYPLEYIFQTVDVVIVISLGVMGLSEIINVLKKKSKRR